MSEYQEQCAIIQWCKLNERKYPELSMINASLNGIPIRPQTIGKIRAQGVKRGYPDLFLPIKCKKYSGLFIELKIKGGVVKEHQREWLDKLQEQGFKAVVRYGSIEAIKEIKKYLEYKR